MWVVVGAHEPWRRWEFGLVEPEVTVWASVLIKASIQMFDREGGGWGARIIDAGFWAEASAWVCGKIHAC